MMLLIIPAPVVVRSEMVGAIDNSRWWETKGLETTRGPPLHAGIRDRRETRRPRTQKPENK
ncbi:hypothetical protein PV779_64335, partial [Streptomyces sp. ID01-9D]|nr:hypothetical protein [Streptomyces sp. ID01-9D]